MPITPINLKSHLETLSITIYSQYGAGKTYLAGTAPRPLFLDFENGTATLMGMKCEKCGRKYWLNKDNGCEVCKDLGGIAFHITDVASLKQVFDCLDIVYKARNRGDEDKEKAKEWLKNNLGKDLDIDMDILLDTKSIVIDTLSRMQESEVIGILDRRDIKRPESEDVMEMREWGMLLTRMYRLMKLLPNQGFNVILLAQAREFEDPIDKRRKWMPNLRGQWGDQIGAYTDLVCYLEVKDIMAGPGKRKTIRRLHLQPTGEFVAKSRYDMPQWIDDSSFSKIQGEVQKTFSAEIAKEVFKEATKVGE